MYIAPNSKIYICNNVPLDNTFQHTIYWDTIGYQQAYFRERAKYVLDNQSYQRVERGKMRIRLLADNIYDCNYLAFQNTAYGNKWFYAFITSIEYVNNDTSEVTFEIDPIQTYWFNPDGTLCTQLRACFVEREHSQTDVVGENLVPENVELGDYVADHMYGLSQGDINLNELCIVVAAPFDEQYNPITGTYYSHVFSGLMYHVFPNSDSGALACAQFIQGAGSKQDEIVSVFMMPKYFMTDPFTGAPDPTSSSIPKTAEFRFYKNTFDIKRTDGTAPHNNKLLTYPYNFLYVTNLQGASAEYHYEYFYTEGDEDHYHLSVSGDVSCSPSVVVVPRNYKGVGLNFDEKIALSGFPQCAFNVDSFRQWLGQNAVSLGLSALGTAVSFGIGMGGASLMEEGAIKSLTQISTIHQGVSGIANILAQGARAAASPRQAHGPSGGSTLAALGMQAFALIPKHIRPEYVDIIDGYFDMFGYATHKVKVPNRNVRAEWTYTKTRDCVLECNAPADDVRKICEIYDNGITFWYNPYHVGRYDLPNPVAVG